jgi:hypothetical protein
MVFSGPEFLFVEPVLGLWHHDEERGAHVKEMLSGPSVSSDAALTSNDFHLRLNGKP